MRLPRGRELRLDPDVQLLRADAEPDPASSPQRLRLLQLLEPEQLTEEPACVLLAAGRGGELDVGDAVEHAARLAATHSRECAPRTSPMHLHLGGSVARRLPLVARARAGSRSR